MSTNDSVQTMQGQNFQPVMTPIAEPRTPSLMVFNHEYRRSAKKEMQTKKAIRKNSPQRKRAKFFFLLCLGLAVLIVAVGIVESVMEHDAKNFILSGVMPLMFCIFAAIPAFAMLMNCPHEKELEAVEDPRILMNDYGFSYSRNEVCKLGDEEAHFPHHFIDNVAFKDIIAIKHYAKTGAYDILCRTDKYVYLISEVPSRPGTEEYFLLKDGLNPLLKPVEPGQQIYPVRRFLFEDRIKIYDCFKGEPFKEIAKGAGLVIDECEPFTTGNEYHQYEGSGKEIGVGHFADADLIDPPGYVVRNYKQSLTIIFWIFFAITAVMTLFIDVGFIAGALNPKTPQVKITGHLDESECYFTKEDIDYVYAYIDEQIDEDFTFDMLSNKRQTLKNGEEVVTSFALATCDESGDDLSWTVTKYLTDSNMHDMGEIKITK